MSIDRSEWCPWPGPVPYDERHSHLFFARQRDLVRMENDVLLGRLTILSAESGCGKTSFLTAGLLPALRARRATGSAPFALLLRGWGGSEDATAEQRLLDAIRSAPAALEESLARLDQSQASARDEGRPEWQATREQLCADIVQLHEFVQSEDARRAASLPHFVQALLGRFDDDVLLIVDQLEELMGSASTVRGPARARQVAETIGQLHADVPDVRLVLSLRSEYADRLERGLNGYVEYLGRRKFPFPPLRRSSTVEIVERGLEFIKRNEARSGVVVDSARCDVRGFAEALEALITRADAAAHGVDPSGDDSALHLLRLQAALLEYFRTAARPGVFIATAAAVGEFQDGESKQGLESALKRYVIRSIGESADGAVDAIVASWGSVTSGADAGEELRTRLRRAAQWILGRILPALATDGGFKVHAARGSLFHEVLDGVLRRSDQVDALLEAFAHRRSAECSARFQHDDLAGVGIDLQRTQGGGHSSESRFLFGLLELAQGVLDSLVDRKVLKRMGSGSSITYELLHDGYAEFTQSWAKDYPRHLLEASLGSPIPIRGQEFAWKELAPEDASSGRLRIEGVRWIGTSLKGVAFERVDFVDCTLIGMFMLDCTFHDVKFIGCNLSAAVFEQSGGDEEDAEGKAVTFEKVRFEACTLRSTAFKRSLFGREVEFVGRLERLGEVDTCKGHRADLTSASFADCCVLHEQPLVFTECILRFALVQQFVRWGGGPRAEPQLTFSRCDLMNAWVWDAGLKSVLVDEGCRTIGLVSFELPTESWLDRGKVSSPPGDSTGRGPELG